MNLKNHLISQEQREHYIQVSDRNQDMHQETKNISYKAINNIIFIVSTGTFVLSVNLISYLKSYILYPYLLVFSWILMLGAIIGSYKAHLLQIDQSVRQIELINTYRDDDFLDQFFKYTVSSDEKLNKIIKNGNIANRITVTCLGSGLGILFVFVSINLLNQSGIRIQEIQAQKIRDINNDQLVKKQIELVSDFLSKNQ